MNIEDTWKPLKEPINMRVRLLKDVKAVQNKMIKERRRIKRELKKILKEMP